MEGGNTSGLWIISSYPENPCSCAFLIDGFTRAFPNRDAGETTGFKFSMFDDEALATCFGVVTITRYFKSCLCLGGRYFF